MARRRRTRTKASRPAAPRRRRASAPKRRRTASRAGRRGSAPVATVAGIALGGAAAIGGAALLTMAANAAKFDLPQIVKDFAPIAGAGAVAGLAALAPKFRALTMPALIGGVAVVMLHKFGTKGAGSYHRLRGAGNVARVLASNVNGAGNVARVLAANAV